MTTPDLDALFQATIARINGRLATDPSLKMINARVEDYQKRLQQAAMDGQRRAETIAREEWTKTIQQVRGY
jgi:hypothetical protein